MISLQRYNQPKRTFSLYVPKKSFLTISPNNIQSTLPKLFIPTQEQDESNIAKSKDIPKIKSFNTNLKKSYKPDVDNEVSKLIPILPNKNTLNKEINIPPLPPLPSPNDPNFNTIFVQKIKICSLIFNFTMPLKQLKAKEIKTTALNEINSLLMKKSDALLLNDQQKTKICQMIIRNIYDQDPFKCNEKIYSSSSITWSFVEPSWDHLKLVYQVLILMISTFPGIFKIDLIKKTVRLMNLPVYDEKLCLISVLKNYNLVHPEQLDEIWRILKNAIANVISDIYTPYCIDPILTFCNNSIRNDYLIDILYTHLLPLYRNEQLYLFSNKLTNLIIKIVDKDMTLQTNTIKFLIKYFPYQCGQKQFLFISSISSIFEIIIGNDLNKIASKLINFLKTIIRSPNNKLAESAVKLLLSSSMTYVLFKNPNLSMQSLYDSLNWSSLYHWDNSVKNISKKGLTILGNIIFEIQKKKGKAPECVYTSRTAPVLNKNSLKPTIENQKVNENKELVARWAQIARNASKMDNSIDLTQSLLKIQENLLNEKKESDDQINLFTTKKYLQTRHVTMFDLGPRIN